MAKRRLPSAKAKSQNRKNTRTLRAKRKEAKPQNPSALRSSGAGAGLPYPFPIVGVGASAGGLEAFTQLLRHLPTDTGLGFVLVQHLDPQHESALAQLLARATSMPVHEVTNNLRVVPNQVYVIPPNTNLSISHGVLRLVPRQETRPPTRSIDSFFESLASNHREGAIGVVLSGTASDGTQGLEAIKAEGGITFAQDDSAKYDSMPRSAVAAGCVDFVLSPEQIAKELARIAKHPYVAQRSYKTSSPADASAMARADDETPLPSGGHTLSRRWPKPARGGVEPADAAASENGFKRILLLLRNHSNVDFSLYKTSTLQRRISRRVVLNKQESMEDYATFLRGNAKELDALYSDVLISVTSFFRNPEAFDFLKRKVFPQLLQQRTDDPIRVWVLGCSTGQEAYSLAMVFSEAAENTPRRRNLQVFATDLNDALLDKARHGLYAKTLAQDIAPERLRRFFAEEEGGYRIIKPIRETVVFARQNLISDPPFSRMDLISCRNLLIYLEPGLQQKALPTFHYALKPGGYLFLGASESIGGFADLFEPADKKHKIFSRKAAPISPIHLPVKKDRRQQTPQARAPLPIGNKEREAPGILHGELSAQREADRVSVNQYTPPGVLINSELQILQFRWSTSAYLQPPSSGRATLDVLKMAREGLMLPLRAAINKAKKDNKTVRKEDVRVQQNGTSRTVSVAVIPLKNLRDRAFLILFEDVRRGARVARGEAAPEVDNSRVGGKQDRRHNASIQRELAETRDYLQSIQEQHEATTEELQASNEEVQSANEELQSINEELETSKEELESSNEELTTVNEEMAHRNTELNRLNADLSNFQASTKLPIVLLARDLTIRRFSPPAEKLFNLLAGDVGRPLSGVRHKLVLPEAGGVLPKRDGSPPTHPAPFPLEDFLREVIDAVREQEREVRDNNGHWYSLRARPYMTVDNKIDGAVLVLVDINDLKRTEEEVKRARDYAEATIRTARDPLVVLRGDLRVDKANDSFYKTFKVTPQETENKLIYELGGGQWDIPKLRQFLEEIIPRNSFFNDFEVIHQFEHIGLRNMLLNARRLDNPAGMPERILVGIEDITERQQAAEALRASEQNFRALFELGPVAVYSCDASGVIQQFNRRAVELWGRTPAPGETDERFCGSHKLFRPDGTFMPHDQCPMAEVVAGRMTAVNDEEVLIERPDGSRITVIVNIRPMRNARGEITGAINCFYDITGRKQAEETRKSLNEQLAVELAATRRLQETSTLLIHEGDVGALYHHILEAAVGIMQSDMASMQRFDEQRGALQLLASQGFHPESAAFWGWVSVDSKSSCAAALRDTKRIIIHDRVQDKIVIPPKFRLFFCLKMSSH